MVLNFQRFYHCILDFIFCMYILCIMEDQYVNMYQKFIQFCCLYYMGGSRGGGGTNHKNIRFHSNTGPMNNHKATNPAVNFNGVSLAGP